MKLVEIKIPFSLDTGAPLPEVKSSEFDVEISVYILYTEKTAKIIFKKFLQYKFGYPNEEAISGHEYYKLGLSPYSFYELLDSNWINELKSRNRVHPYHSDNLFKNYKHYLLPLHDNTFEVIAESYEFVY